LQAGTVEEALNAATRLVQTNQERRRLGSEAWDLIQDDLRQSLAKSNGAFAIVGSEAIKPGITGLLASRAANLFNVPVIVAAFKPDGTCTGSIRSNANFPLVQLLSSAADLFLDYGGHDSAAGFTLMMENGRCSLNELLLL